MNNKSYLSENIVLSRRQLLLGFAALSTGLLLPASATTQFQPFSFAFISNSHLCIGLQDNGFKLLQESQLFLQESIKLVNTLAPDFVIFGGDQVEQPGKDGVNWQLFVDIVQGLTMPWYFILGENDISSRPPVDKLQFFGLDWKAHGIKQNTPYWSKDMLDGIHIIGLDSSQANTATGYLSSSQLQWLQEDLATNVGKYTIIFSHHPLLPPAPYNNGSPWNQFTLINSLQAQEIVNSFHDIALVVSSHLYLNKIQLEKNIYHISCAALDAYPCQLKLFTITPESIIVKSYTVPFPALIKKAKQLMLTSPLAEKYNSKNPQAILELCKGKAEDQSAFLSLANTKTIQKLSNKKTQRISKR